MTNADRIRSMSNEELATFLADGGGDRFCRNDQQCGDDLDNNRHIPLERCAACALAWLREEEDNDD